jgi:hypothetical protein
MVGERSPRVRSFSRLVAKVASRVGRGVADLPCPAKLRVPGASGTPRPILVRIERGVPLVQSFHFSVIQFSATHPAVMDRRYKLNTAN